MEIDSCLNEFVEIRKIVVILQEFFHCNSKQFLKNKFEEYNLYILWFYFCHLSIIFLKLFMYDPYTKKCKPRANQWFFFG